MANTYDWKINQLDAKIHQDNLENVIYIVHWSYLATDDSVEPITVNLSGAMGVEYNEGDPFIPYNELTKEIVVSWLENNLEVDALKLSLDKQIELKKNPVDEYLHPDWD